MHVPQSEPSRGKRTAPAELQLEPATVGISLGPRGDAGVGSGLSDARVPPLIVVPWFVLSTSEIGIDGAIRSDNAAQDLPLLASHRKRD
jgi:hypothetical protein